MRKLTIGLSTLSLLLAAFQLTASSVEAVDQNNWSLTYTATDGDGTAIYTASYKGIRVFSRASLPFIKVNYSETTACCTDNLDNSVRKSGPTLTNITGGFRISSVYCFGYCSPYDEEDSFGYKYVEYYFFYDTGAFTARVDVYGPGLYANATYEALFRVDYDVDTIANTFDQYSSGSWVRRTSEGTFCDDGNNDQYGNEWKQNNSVGNRNYHVDPPISTIAYCVLALKFNSAETTSNGSNYPTIWDNNESLSGSDDVQWDWGYRAYSRPVGCQAGGAGCTTGFPILFDARNNGW